MIIFREFFKLRMFVASIFVAFITLLSMSEVVRFANDMKTPLSIYYVPHLFSNIHFVFFYGMSVCYLFSDIHVISKEFFFAVIRIGRTRYYCYRILVAFIQSISLYLTVILTVIMTSVPNISWEFKWGKLIHTLCFFGAGYEYQIIPISQWRIETYYSPMEAMMLSALITVSVCVFIAIVLCLTGCLFGKHVTTVVSVLLCLNTYFLMIFEQHEFFYYLTPFNWLRLSLFGQEYLPGIYYPSFKDVFLLTMILSAILFVINCIIVNYRDLTVEGI